MEDYATRTLIDLFRNHAPAPDHFPDLYDVRARNIVDALKLKHPYEADFRRAFWKIRFNLDCKGPKALETMEHLFAGRWRTAEDFVNATDDDLDSEKAEFRCRARNAYFDKMQHTKQFLEAVLNGSGSRSGRGGGGGIGGCGDGGSEGQGRAGNGLTCPRCKATDTEYLLLQTSRGDEGSTARSLCNACGHRWKFR